MYEGFMAIMTAVPRITAKFLETDSKIHTTPHTGIDYAVSEGTKLLSSSNGIIEEVVDYGNTNIGRGVFIRLDNGIKLIYGHMSKIEVKPGQKVNAGDIIGLSGNTGRSTGAHLHLQAYDSSGNLIDPAKFAEGVFNKSSSNANGEKFLEWLNKNFNTNFKPESGLLGEDLNKTIDDKINIVIDNLYSRIGKFFSAISVDLLDVVSLGVLGYSFYNCIKTMMLNNRSSNGGALPLDKAIFGYFIFFILRILTTVVKIRGGLIGK